MVDFLSGFLKCSLAGHDFFSRPGGDHLRKHRNFSGRVIKDSCYGDRTGCAEKASLFYLPRIVDASKPKAQKSLAAAELTANVGAKDK
jgi:hypothetical protein